MPVGPASGGGGGKSGDVRAGGAYIEVRAEDTLSNKLIILRYRAMKFAEGMKQVGQKINEYLSPVGKRVMLAGTAALAPLAALFKGGLNYAEEIYKSADALGFTVEQMQRLQYAATVAGVSVEEVLRKPEQYGGLMGQATVLDASAIRESVEANRSLRAAWLDLQLALVPLVQTFGPILKGFSEFVRRNSELLPVVAAGAAGLIALGAALWAVGPAITAVGVAIQVAINPFVLITAAAAGIGYALTRLAKVIFPETHAAAVSFFGDLGSLAADTFGGIVAAIGKGDLSLALEVLTAGATAVWKRFTLELTGLWVDFKNFVLDGLRDIKAGFAAAFDPGVLKRIFRGEGLMGAIAGEAAPGGAIDRAAEARNAQRDADRAFRQKQLDDAAKEAEGARKKLADLVAKAQARPVAGPVEDLAKRITATRGAFRLLGDASQQFGNVDIPKQQLDSLKRIEEKAGAIVTAIQNGQSLLRFR